MRTGTPTPAETKQQKVALLPPYSGLDELTRTRRRATVQRLMEIWTWRKARPLILTHVGNTAIIVKQLRTGVDNEIVSSFIGHC